MKRAAADPIDGVLALDKPVGMSSNLALQKARRLLQARKAGHTGTLDPLASGLLPLTFGEATKFSADLLDADKEYEATLALGVSTDSGDAEGAVLEQRPVAVSRAQLEQVLSRFTGTLQQVPPMHSALKYEGRPLYELARRGLTVARAARTVHIARLELLEWDALRPRLAVACSKGTYVRVLAQDIGAALGCGAHLAALRRTRVGPLRLDQAAPLAALEAQPLAARRAALLPLDTLLGSLPAVALDARAAARFAHGQRVALAGAPEAARVRVAGPDGRLLGLARGAGGWLEPLRLLAQAPGEPTNTGNEETR
jgi:tRNA pseudouridine55 synthase